MYYALGSHGVNNHYYLFLELLSHRALNLCAEQSTMKPTTLNTILYTAVNTVQFRK